MGSNSNVNQLLQESLPSSIKWEIVETAGGYTARTILFYIQPTQAQLLVRNVHGLFSPALQIHFPPHLHFYSVLKPKRCCTHCWQPSHTKSQCPNLRNPDSHPAEEHKRDLSAPACKRCYSFEHLSSSCILEDSQCTCSLCLSKGHPAYKCKKEFHISHQEIHTPPIFNHLPGMIPANPHDTLASVGHTNTEITTPAPQSARLNPHTMRFPPLPHTTPRPPPQPIILQPGTWSSHASFNLQDVAALLDKQKADLKADLKAEMAAEMTTQINSVVQSLSQLYTYSPQSQLSSMSSQRKAIHYQQSPLPPQYEQHPSISHDSMVSMADVEPSYSGNPTTPQQTISTTHTPTSQSSSSPPTTTTTTTTTQAIPSTSQQSPAAVHSSQLQPIHLVNNNNHTINPSNTITNTISTPHQPTHAGNTSSSQPVANPLGCDAHPAPHYHEQASQ